MSAKTSPARGAAFFAALVATGNQTLAAERAKVSRSWVSLHRATDPAFRAAMEAAVAGATVRLAGVTGVRPAGGWSTQAGVELAVRGTNGRRVQVARARVRQWTPRVEGRFLTALRRTCNVTAACEVVALSVASAYGHRNRWAAFAASWDGAVEEGLVRLEASQLATARGFLASPEVPAETEIPITGMTAVGAAALLRLHGKGYPRRGRVGGPPAKPDVGAMLRTLEKHLAAAERVVARRNAASGAAGPGVGAHSRGSDAAG